MAIAKGQVSKDAVEFKRYIGVASCFVKAVNPTKEVLNKLYNSDSDKEPEYVSSKDGVDNVRISFVVQPDPNDYGDVLVNHNYFLRKEYRYNKDKTKVQVIDKYGRTAWVTIEQAKNHEIPMYSNGPANLDKDYRPAFVGEEELTEFLINYLNIPSVQKYNRDEKKWYLVDNPEECECRLDEIPNYFKGNFSELNTAINLQPNNKVKILFGVRTSSDGKQYQASYTRMTLKNSVSNYSKLDEDVQTAKNNGAYADTEFKTCDFQEYKVEATAFEQSAATSELPFDVNDPFAVMA